MPIDFFYDSQYLNPRCECCSKGFDVTASTYTVRKWTREEIVDNLLILNREMITTRWYNRADVRRRMAHWDKKLRRYDEADSEFTFNQPK